MSLLFLKIPAKQIIFPVNDGLKSCKKEKPGIDCLNVFVTLVQVIFFSSLSSPTPFLFDLDNLSFESGSSYQASGTRILYVYHVMSRFHLRIIIAPRDRRATILTGARLD